MMVHWMVLLSEVGWTIAMYLERGIHCFSAGQLTEAMTVTLLNVNNAGFALRCNFRYGQAQKSNQARGDEETKYHVRDTTSIYYVLSKVMNAVKISMI